MIVRAYLERLHIVEGSVEVAFKVQGTYLVLCDTFQEEIEQMSPQAG